MAAEIRIASIIGGFVAIYLLMFAHRTVVRRYWEPVLEEELDEEPASTEYDQQALDE